VLHGNLSGNDKYPSVAVDFEELFEVQYSVTTPGKISKLFGAKPQTQRNIVIKWPKLKAIRQLTDYYNVYACGLEELHNRSEIISAVRYVHFLDVIVFRTWEEYKQAVDALGIEHIVGGEKIHTVFGDRAILFQNISHIFPK
jgi:uncharacterized protein (DUF1330 family)